MCTVLTKLAMMMVTADAALIAMEASLMRAVRGPSAGIFGAPLSVGPSPSWCWALGSRDEVMTGRIVDGPTAALLGVAIQVDGIIEEIAEWRMCRNRIAYRNASAVVIVFFAESVRDRYKATELGRGRLDRVSGSDTSAGCASAG